MRFFHLLLIFALHTAAISAQNDKNQRIVSGSVLLLDKSPLNAQALAAVLKTDWKLKVDSLHSADKTIVFNTGNATVMLAHLPYAADPVEIGAAAQLSWLWPNAAKETLRHQSQVVISVMGSPGKALELHRIFTKVAAAVLENNASCGVYMNTQYLLLSKGFYSAAAHNMLDNAAIPVYCWVYFGMPGDGGAYTYGMQEFGLMDMEVVKSSHNQAEVHSILYDAAASVIKYDNHVADGQAIITEDGAKITVKRAPGVFLEGQTVLRLEY